MPIPFPAEFIPYHQARKRSTLHVIKTPFGDGYRQRIPDGINSIEEVWEIEFRGLNQTQGNQLETFLKTWKGIDLIIWQSPDRNGDFTWLIEDSDRQYGRGMFSSVRCTLRRFSDPYTGGFLQCLPVLSHFDFSQQPGFNGMVVYPQMVRDLAAPERSLSYDTRTQYDDNDQPILPQNFPVLATNYRNGLSALSTSERPFIVGWVLSPAPEQIQANEDFVFWFVGQSDWIGANWAILWAGDTANGVSWLHIGRASGQVSTPTGFVPAVRSEIAIGVVGGSGGAQSGLLSIDQITGFGIWTVRRAGGVVRWYLNGLEYGAAVFTGAIGLDYILTYIDTRSRFNGWIGELGVSQGLTVEQHDELIANLGKKWNLPVTNLHE